MIEDKKRRDHVEESTRKDKVKDRDKKIRLDIIGKIKMKDEAMIK